MLKFSSWFLMMEISVLLATSLPVEAEHGTEPQLIDRPNIILVFSDDHAQRAISCYGSDLIKTPHLDALATRGTRFSNSFVTNSICAPSRATLMTGQYSHANGVPVFNEFDGSRDNFVKRLQAGGYHTGIVGKWHLGSMPTGFDRWAILPGQGIYFDPTFLVPGARIEIQGHCTPVTMDLGLEFLRTRPLDQPFFLMINPKAPHRNWDPDLANKKRYAEKQFPEPATLWDDYKTRPAALPENEQRIADDLSNLDLKLAVPEGLNNPELQQWRHTMPMSVNVAGKNLTGEELVRWKYQRYMQDYLACVQGIDDNLGRLVEFLKANGLFDNTIIVYTSDNGWYLGEFGMYDKRFMYEPGLRVPLIAAGPGIKVGHVAEPFVANIDLAPTFLALAGEQIPESMQGVSLKPLLQGESPPDWRKSVYYRYYHDPGHHNTRAHLGVRTPTYKLIYYWKKDAYEMYDLIADPNEQYNLLFNSEEATRPEVAAKFQELKQEIARLQTWYGDQGQFANPDSWPKTGVDGMPDVKNLGAKTIAETIELSEPQAATQTRQP
jgi:arylsulfatase A-like enzyme